MGEALASKQVLCSCLTPGGDWASVTCHGDQPVQGDRWYEGGGMELTWTMVAFLVVWFLVGWALFRVLCRLLFLPEGKGREKGRQAGV